MPHSQTFKLKDSWRYSQHTEARVTGMTCNCEFVEGVAMQLYFKTQADIFNIATFYWPFTPWYDFQIKHEVMIRPPGEASRLVATFESNTIWSNPREAFIGPVKITPKNAGTMEITVISYYRYRTWPWWWSPWGDATAHVWEKSVEINPRSE